MQTNVGHWDTNDTNVGHHIHKKSPLIKCHIRIADLNHRPPDIKDYNSQNIRSRKCSGKRIADIFCYLTCQYFLLFTTDIFCYLMRKNL